MIGTADKRPLGAYDYEKRLESGATIPCNTTVFPLPVERLEDRWPEAGQRERLWFEPEKAAGVVNEPNLALILRSLRA
ncbi:hypothetical protein [Antarcticirhabdus aurantiaca]|uniref:hypothetical protein n=1 Tax=Antarcticirhabdus aurantiaca TaxID=2606717 RepID=UPI0034E2D8BA